MERKESSKRRYSTQNREDLMSYQQIADAMGIHETTVRDIERRALAKIRDIFLQRGYLRGDFYD